MDAIKGVYIKHRRVLTRMTAGGSPIRGVFKLAGLEGLTILKSLSMQYVLEKFRAREQGSRLLVAPITFKRFNTTNMRFAVAVLYTMDDAHGSLIRAPARSRGRSDA
jgi:hypothetical protein